MLEDVSKVTVATWAVNSLNFDVDPGAFHFFDKDTGQAIGQRTPPATDRRAPR